MDQIENYLDSKDLLSFPKKIDHCYDNATTLKRCQGKKQQLSPWPIHRLDFYRLISEGMSQPLPPLLKPLLRNKDPTMRFGFSPTQADPTFEPMLQQAKLAESLGFDTLWVHEHHSQAMTYPSPLMTLAVLAPHTQRVTLGTNMVLLPLYHPLRVAEEAAMVDVMSGGRLILGVSAGYAPDEYQAFGISRSDRGKRMRQGLTLIRAV